MVMRAAVLSSLASSAIAATCHAVNPVVTDAWCTTNCNASPPNCPASLCSCAPTPAPAPTPVPPHPPLSRVVLVGLYDAEESIHAYELTSDEGKPLQLLTKSVAGSGVSWITASGHAHPGTSVSVFAVSEIGNTVASLELDCDGALKETSRVDSNGGGPVFLSVDPAGEHLLCANYAGGTVAVLPISAEASGSTLQQAEQVMKFGAESHAHSAVFAPGTTSVFVPTLGLDFVQQLLFRDGKLSSNGAPLTVPSSQGPRHIAFHPTLPVAVLANEGSASAECTVVLCRFDAGSGRLEKVATVPTLPSSISSTQMYPAEVLFSPDGAFVLVSNRDANGQQRDGITVFELNQGDSLTFKQYTKVGWYPRSMALADDGLLVVGNQKGDSLSVLRMDFSTGELKMVADDFSVGGSPGFVGIFELASGCHNADNALMV